MGAYIYGTSMQIWIRCICTCSHAHSFLCIYILVDIQRVFKWQRKIGECYFIVVFRSVGLWRQTEIICRNCLVYIIRYVVAIASIPLMPKSFSGLLLGQLIQNLSSARGIDIFLHVCTMLLAAVKFVGLLRLRPSLVFCAASWIQDHFRQREDSCSYFRAPYHRVPDTPQTGGHVNVFTAHVMEYELFCAKRFVVIITWASWGIGTSCPLSMCYLGHFAHSLCLLFIKSLLSALLLTPPTNMHQLGKSDMLFLWWAYSWSHNFYDIRDLRHTIPWALQVEIPAKRFLKNYWLPWPMSLNCTIWEIGNWLSVLVLSISVDRPPGTASV